jgi:hypothetical protein
MSWLKGSAKIVFWLSMQSAVFLHFLCFVMMFALKRTIPEEKWGYKYPEDRGSKLL